MYDGKEFPFILILKKIALKKEALLLVSIQFESKLNVLSEL